MLKGEAIGVVSNFTFYAPGAVRTTVAAKRFAGEATLQKADYVFERGRCETPKVLRRAADTDGKPESESGTERTDVKQRRVPRHRVDSPRVTDREAPGICRRPRAIHYGCHSISADVR